MHVIDSCGLYGAEMIILALMEHQKKTGHKPMLLSLGDLQTGEKELERAARERGVPACPLRFRKGLNIKGSLQIIEHARKYGADIIHSHGYKSDILLGMLPRSYRPFPVLTTLHGWTSVRLFSKMGLYRVMDIIAIKRLDKVVSVTSATYNYKAFKYLCISFDVIHNGVPPLSFDEYEFERTFPDAADACQGNYKILSVGRLSPEKGVDVLIRSVSLLRQRGVPAVLVIMGDGKMKDSLVGLIQELNMTDHVIMLGYQERAYRFMPFFDLFALPSFTEGLPVTMLEAMQAKLPVVATSVGEVPTLLSQGRFGMLVPPGDCVGFSNAAQYVFDHINEMKDNALRCFEENLGKYSIESMSNAYLDQYKKLTH